MSKHRFRIGEYVRLLAPWPGRRPGTLPASEQWDCWPADTVLYVTKTSTVQVRGAEPLLRYQVSDGRVARWLDESYLASAQLTLELFASTEENPTHV